MTTRSLVPSVCAAVLAVAAVLAGSRAEACSPWAERLVGWDARNDVVVVAIWTERDRPPSSRRAPPPEQYELRRLSTGRGLATHQCPAPAADGAAVGPGLCDWQTAFAKVVPGLALAGRRGPGLKRGLVRVRTVKLPRGSQEFVLESPGPGGWRPITWLDFIAEDYPERRRYQLLASERVGDEVVLALEYLSRGANCDHTVVQTLRLLERDLRQPLHPERRARLLSRMREDRPFGAWRTIAAFGPLPPERLIEALEVAETVGQPQMGARWWRDGTAPLPPDRRAALALELAKRQSLPRTRELLSATPPAAGR